MGTIYAVIPVLYFITKPLYGFIIDYFVRQRTFIFTMTVALMGVFYLLIYFVPQTPLQKNSPTNNNVSCIPVLFCDLHVRKRKHIFNIISTSNIKHADNISFMCQQKHDYPNWTVNQVCDLSCKNGIEESGVEVRLFPNQCNSTRDINTQCNVSQVDCNIKCDFLDPVSYVSLEKLFKTSSFWIFVSLMALGSIGFNIVNTASDAICFNALGTKITL